MKSLEDSVVTAMDGSDRELFPYLPYILQDTWEIGTDPEVIIELVRKHANIKDGLHALDLGCGKGAVSVRLAADITGCQCHGIDAISEFIAEASTKASEYRVGGRCRFETGDIRERMSYLPRYDVIILGAIGPVLGDYAATLSALSGLLNDGGIIIIDDGYTDNDSDFSHPLILRRKDIEKQTAASGMKIIDEVIIGKDDIRDSDDQIFRSLKKRCVELAEKHPDQRILFDNYIRKQEYENDVLETKIICSVMVFRKQNHNGKPIRIQQRI